MVVFRLFDESEEALLRRCSVFYYAVGNSEPPEDIDIKRIDSLTTYKIRTDLQPLLRKRDRFDLVAAQDRIKDYLSNLLVLDDNEQQFLEAFRQGVYKPELLFDGEKLDNVRNHPMVLWKLQSR